MEKPTKTEPSAEASSSFAAGLTPREVRLKIRSQEITGQTSGMCPGYAQANLVVLPRELAYDFLLFTQRNPKPCPLLEVTDTGSPLTHYIADADIASEEMYREADLFADLPEEQEKAQQLEKEKNIQQAIMAIKGKFGKNSILKAMNMQEFATMRERNGQIGGHKA